MQLATSLLCSGGEEREKERERERVGGLLDWRASSKASCRVYSAVEERREREGERERESGRTQSSPARVFWLSSPLKQSCSLLPGRCCSGNIGRRTGLPPRSRLEQGDYYEGVLTEDFSGNVASYCKGCCKGESTKSYAVRIPSLLSLYGRVGLLQWLTLEMSLWFKLYCKRQSKKCYAVTISADFSLCRSHRAGLH